MCTGKDCPGICNRRKGVTTGATCPWNYDFTRCPNFKVNRDFEVVTNTGKIKTFSTSSK